MADRTHTARPSRIESVRFLADARVPGAAVRDIIALTSRRLAVPCRLHPEPWRSTPRRLDGRDQFDADALLSELESSAEAGVVQVGLTGVDLGLTLFTFVFGRATVSGRAAVVSLARLSPEVYGLAPDPDLTVRRAVAEVVHELGHVAGLAHCADLGCIMYFATNVETVDLRGTGFCPACATGIAGRLVPAPGG